MRKIRYLLAAAVFASILPGPLANAAPYAEYPFTYEDFEDGDDKCVVQSVASSYQIVDEGYGNTAHSMQINIGGNFQEVSFPLSMEVGKEYTLSCRICPLSDLAADQISFMMYFNEKTEDGEPGERTAYLRHTVEGLSLKEGVWTKVESKYTFSGKGSIVGVGPAEVVGTNGRISLRFGDGTLANINDGGGFSYLIDDLYVEPELSPSDIEDDPEPSEPEEEKPTLEGEWQIHNAETEASQDVPPDTDITEALHITQTGRNGYAYKNTNLIPGNEYKLSFYAKGSSASGLAIKPVIAYDDGSYTVTDDSLVFNDEWTNYSVTFNAPAEKMDNARFYFLTGSAMKKTDYYIAGLLIEKNEKEEPEPDPGDGKLDTPEIKQIVSEGFLAKGNPVKINAEYLGKGEQSGLIQLLKKADDGGWASVKTQEFTSDGISYTVTNNDIGQNFKARIIPMDKNGKIGGYREKDLGIAADELSVSSEFTSGLDNNVSADVKIKCFKEEQDIVCVLMLYDKDGARISEDYKTISVGYNDDVTLSISAAKDENAVSARLFVWEGTSDIDTTMISLTDYIEIQK